MQAKELPPRHFVQPGARIGSGIESNSAGNGIADCPARFAIECLYLYIPGILGICLDDRVFPETPVGRALDFDGRWGIANVAVVNFNSST